MLDTLQNAFQTSQIPSPSAESGFVELHSNTSKGQGLFLQEMFDVVRPKKSIEVGLAYGISALFVLEKHKENNSSSKSHIIIEPFPWDGVPEYNIEKEQLTDLVEYIYEKSDVALPKLSLREERVQFAYIDTTKVFDTVLQDFYFIDKMLDVNGMIILDDCNGGWPGVQRVARFISTLPHYQVFARHNKLKFSFKVRTVSKLVSLMMKLIPFKKKFYPTCSFQNDEELGLDYSCIAFRKIAEDTRNWNWDRVF